MRRPLDAALVVLPLLVCGGLLLYGAGERALVLGGLTGTPGFAGGRVARLGRLG